MDDLISDLTQYHLCRRRYRNRRTGLLACFKRIGVDARLLEPTYSGSLAGLLPPPLRDVLRLRRGRDGTPPLSQGIHVIFVSLIVTELLLSR